MENDSIVIIDYCGYSNMTIMRSQLDFLENYLRVNDEKTSFEQLNQKHKLIALRP